MNNIVILFSFLSFFLYMFLKVSKDLHMVQLNSYRVKRYQKWVIKNITQYINWRNTTPLIALIILFFSKSYLSIGLWGACYLFLIFSNVNYPSKLPLQYTSRAKRLYSVIIGEFTIIVSIILYNYYLSNSFYVLYLGIITLSLLCYFSFVTAIIGSLIIAPLEKMIDQWYYNDAKSKINKYSNLITIGVTGSFGKTSTKFILFDLLSPFFNTLMTPHSFNTKMGVTKIVRNELSPIHDIFIAEMGAKQRGDIKQICDMVKPQIAILTAIGEQHLETFKDIRNIKKTKAELIESLPNTGTAIMNGDDTNIRSLIFKNSPRKIFFGIDSDLLDYKAQDVEVTNEGTFFTVITHKNNSAKFFTKLLGRHNIYNVLAAIATACEIGVELERLIPLVKKINPPPHRLELIKKNGGITIIDNSFSSNPVGAKIALEVLEQMPGNKKILITPGMVELGLKEYDYNKDFGIRAAKVCDFIILVGKKRSTPINNGLVEAGYPTSNLYIAKDLDSASLYLKTILQPRDIVLYENDLPDNYLE